jgi:hypothetical protein
MTNGGAMPRRTLAILAGTGVVGVILSLILL